MALQSLSSLSDPFEFSKQNLDLLLADSSCVHQHQYVTKASLQAFNDIQAARLGWSHAIKKRVWSGLVHGGLRLTPPTCALTALYYGMDTIKAQVTPILTVIVLNELCNLAIGHRFTTLASVASYRAWDTISERISKEFLDGYTHLEQQSQEVIHASHEKIKIELMITYEGMARELANRYTKAYPDPKSAREVHLIVKKLQSLLPKITDSLGLLELSPQEIREILYSLNQTIEIIEKHRVAFRKGQTAFDNEYNASLMVDFTSEEFAAHAISSSVRKTIEEAAKYRLGIAHTIQAYASAFVDGAKAIICIPALSALSTFMAEYAGYISSDWKENAVDLLQGYLDEQTMPIAYVSTVIGIMTIATAIKMGSDRLQYYTHERTQADAVVKRSNTEAVQELKSIYTGIANYLATNQDINLVRNIEKKIAILNKQILATGITNNPSIITEDLKKITSTPTT